MLLLIPFPLVQRDPPPPPEPDQRQHPPDGPRGDEGVHIGAMFRFKGLEYQRMITAGVAQGLVLRENILRLRTVDALRHRGEL